MAQYDVFLSYAGPDADLAKWIHHRLEAAGLCVYLDSLDLEPGSSVATGLVRAIRGATYFVPLVTEQFMRRGWTRYELESALAHQPDGKVIPVLRGVDRGKAPPVLAPFSPLVLPADEEAAGAQLAALAAHVRGEDVPGLRRRQRDSRPEPRYPDANIRDEALRLRELNRLRAEKEAEGEGLAAIDDEIVQLKRVLRQGAQLHAGDQLGDGRFELIEVAGMGGFATVWKAYDARDERVVALKLLHTLHAQDASRIERFFRGAREMARLRHPGIVSVVEPHGVEDGYCWFVMEYLNGGDLKRAVEEGRIRGEAGLSVLRPIADALAHAHARGLVHRDVKPENILLDRAEGTRLTDFDLVRAPGTTAGTRGGLGTFLYAAPEAQLDASDVGPQADVYSLGMTALFVLHGGELPAIAQRRPEEVLDEQWCSQAVKRVVSRAIEFKEGSRFATVAQFAEALDEALAAGEPPARTEHREQPVLLAAKGLTVQFGSALLFRDLSLAIRRGELVAFLGRTGTGRGLLMRILAGMQRPTAGDVRLGGGAADSSRVGYVEGPSTLLDDVTVLEMLRDQAEQYPTDDGGPAEDRVRAALERVGLEFIAERSGPGLVRAEISMNMQWRVAIAMELLREPVVLFLDLATAVADPEFHREIVRAARGWTTDELTVILSIGSLGDRELFLFDRVVLLSPRDLAWSGPPNEAVPFVERASGTPAPIASNAVEVLLERERFVHFHGSAEYERHVERPLCEVFDASAPPGRPTRSARGRLRTLTRQRSRRTIRRRSTWARIFVEAPGLAAVVALLPTGGAGSDEWSLYGRLLPVLVFWFGVSGLTTALAREFGRVRHELALGLRVRTLLGAWLLAESWIVLAQVLLVFATGALFAGLPACPLAVVAVLSVVAVAAMAHGLLLSALAATRRWSGGAFSGVTLGLMAVQAAFAGPWPSAPGLRAWIGVPVLTRWAGDAVAGLQAGLEPWDVSAPVVAVVVLGVAALAGSARLLRRFAPGGG